MNYAATHSNELVEFEPCSAKWSAAQLYNITVPLNNTVAALGNRTVVVPVLPWNLLSADTEQESRAGKYGPPPDQGSRPSSCVRLITGLSGTLIGLGAAVLILLAIVFCYADEPQHIDLFPWQLVSSATMSVLTLMFMFFIFQTKLNDAGTCYVVGYSPGIWRGLAIAGYVIGGISTSAGGLASLECSRSVLIFLAALLAAALLAIYLMPFIALMQVGSGAVIGLAVAALLMLVDFFLCGKKL
jgi:hypothetical protein